MSGERNSVFCSENLHWLCTDTCILPSWLLLMHRATCLKYHLFCLFSGEVKAQDPFWDVNCNPSAMWVTGHAVQWPRKQIHLFRHKMSQTQKPQGTSITVLLCKIPTEKMPLPGCVLAFIRGALYPGEEVGDSHDWGDLAAPLYPSVFAQCNVGPSVQV